MKTSQSQLVRWMLAEEHVVDIPPQPPEVIGLMQVTRTPVLCGSSLMKEEITRFLSFYKARTVLFTAASPYESPHITHIVVGDGPHTLCGRSACLPQFPWGETDVEPGCRRCAKALARLKGRGI